MKNFKEGVFNEAAQKALGPNIVTKINWNENRQKVTAGKINTAAGVVLNNKSLQALESVSKNFSLPCVEIKRSGAGLMILLTN